MGQPGIPGDQPGHLGTHVPAVPLHDAWTEPSLGPQPRSGPLKITGNGVLVTWPGGVSARRVRRRWR